MTGRFEWTNLTVLVTGGTGSFGGAALPVLLARGVERVIVFSRDELKQAQLLEAYRGQPVEGFLGDIRDADRLRWAFRAGVDVVIHAAALKQVPSCQYNWAEAIATNIAGSTNVVKAAIEADIPRLIALSTDKACQPVNTYGKTKAVMEEIVTWANAWVGRGRTKLACVRYGNVINSRGSIVPLLRAQAITGVVSITDPAMTRFWMTLGQAVEFVLSSIELMAGGEIFVPKPAVSSLSALAGEIAPGCRWDITGRRPGEKLHEALLSADEALSARDLGDRFAIYPHGATWPVEPRGLELPLGFSYTSDRAPAANLAEVFA